MKRQQHVRPLYQVVMDSILGQIETGELKAQERLPSESELCDLFSVGRNTVRRALSELVDEGVLKTLPGLGTFVEDSRVTKTAEYLLGFTQEMHLHQRTVTSQVLEAKIIAADPYLTRRLRVQLGAEIVFLYRVREMDGEPIAIERSYLPHSLCPNLLAYDFSNNSLYRTLSDIYNRKPFHAEQEIEASFATSEVAKLLKLRMPAVVLVFHRETYLASGEVIEYVDSELRADRFRFYANLRLQSTHEEGAFRRLPVYEVHRE
ncbi:MAG: GntR family transcriptional regulator [Anaerolineales bacterium]|nr:GntR family transcriptional regulator [Anaerolineales bacterium]